jgi:uncharacterized membrane protein
MNRTGSGTLPPPSGVADPNRVIKKAPEPSVIAADARTPPPIPRAKRDTDEEMVPAYDAARRLQDLREAMQAAHDQSIASERAAADAERERCKRMERRLWGAIATLGTLCLALGIGVAMLIGYAQENRERLDRLERVTDERAIDAR